MDIILASSSPRRRELLEQLGVSFEIRAADIDEAELPGESSTDLVERLALNKAKAVAEKSDEAVPVLGADTLVEIDGQVLGKPEARDDALRMLSSLSNREHRVLSAVALVGEGYENVLLSVTKVRFRSLSEQEMLDYWSTGEPLGKAGGYAIQGLAAVFITEIQGSYSGVMGLPLYETGLLLKEVGLQVI